MAPHKCEQISEIRTISNKLTVLYLLIGVFVFLTGFTASSAYQAKSDVQVVKTKVEVHEERFNHIMEGIKRIEETLKRKKP